MDPFILKKLNERNDLLNSEGYDQSADIWSLGAMCYEMLMGKRVFTGRNIKDLYKKVEIGNYTLPTHLSKEVVSFINGMLQYDSSKRLTIEELSRHHFLTRKTKDFNTIDFVLVAEKLGTKGIYINTKKNETMWNIFNEETEVKLSNIPTRILDKNTFPDNLPGESEFESKNDVQILPKAFENITQNEQYPNYNDNFNKININQLTQNEFNFKNKKDNAIKKEDKKIQNTDNFGGNNKNISNSHIQFNPKVMHNECFNYLWMFSIFGIKETIDMIRGTWTIFSIFPDSLIVFWLTYINFNHVLIFIKFII
jgi:serine/threonine protein kinase